MKSKCLISKPSLSYYSFVTLFLLGVLVVIWAMFVDGSIWAKILGILLGVVLIPSMLKSFFYYIKYYPDDNAVEFLTLTGWKKIKREDVLTWSTFYIRGSSPRASASVIYFIELDLKDRKMFVYQLIKEKRFDVLETYRSIFEQKEKDLGRITIGELRRKIGLSSMLYYVLPRQ